MKKILPTLAVSFATVVSQIAPAQADNICEYFDGTHATSEHPGGYTRTGIRRVEGRLGGKVIGPLGAGKKEGSLSDDIGPAADHMIDFHGKPALRWDLEGRIAFTNHKSDPMAYLEKEYPGKSKQIRAGYLTFQMTRNNMKSGLPLTAAAKKTAEALASVGQSIPTSDGNGFKSATRSNILDLLSGFPVVAQSMKCFDLRY